MLLLFISFVASLVLGILSHFAFDFFDYNYWLGFFVPTSESIFEHTKLLLYPVLAVSIIELFLFSKNILSDFASRIFSLAIGICIVPALYYAYTAIFGKQILALDIAIYVIALAFTYFMSYFLAKNNTLPNRIIFIAFMLLLGLVFFVTIFTLDPLSYSFFQPIG